jgi:dienelactone hydrolase
VNVHHVAETARSVVVPADGARLEGDLVVPERSHGIVLFAHGSGSDRHSPRNRAVADTLNAAGFATLLIDLLTSAEEEVDRGSGRYRFDIGLLARRLIAAVEWLRRGGAPPVPIGLFGASTGAAAALVTAAARPADVAAVVSRGGRPDLAGPALPRVHAPTLLIVGGADRQVLELNRQALELLGASQKQLVVVPGASHLFEEPGALDRAAELAVDWFSHYLAGAAREEPT